MLLLLLLFGLLRFHVDFSLESLIIFGELVQDVVELLGRSILAHRLFFWENHELGSFLRVVVDNLRVVFVLTHRLQFVMSHLWFFVCQDLFALVVEITEQFSAQHLQVVAWFLFSSLRLFHILNGDFFFLALLIESCDVFFVFTLEEGVSFGVGIGESLSNLFHGLQLLGRATFGLGVLNHDLSLVVEKFVERVGNFLDYFRRFERDKARLLFPVLVFSLEDKVGFLLVSLLLNKNLYSFAILITESFVVELAKGRDFLNVFGMFVLLGGNVDMSMVSDVLVERPSDDLQIPFQLFLLNLGGDFDWLPF